MGDSGLRFIEELAAMPPGERRPRAFAAADFRGFDDDAVRFAAGALNLASYGSVAMCHIVGIAPDASALLQHRIAARGANPPPWVPVPVPAAT